jgi:fructose-bisphosphate aldolase class I
MNQMNNVPWELSFSYGRALQAAALKAWRGKDVQAGQQALRHRAECNGAARFGAYSDEVEQWKDSAKSAKAEFINKKL